MLIYIDIGANNGDSVRVAMKYPFDQILAFEPSRLFKGYLHELESKDPRVTIFPCALGKTPGLRMLHNAGTVGGSFYSDKVIFRYDNMAVGIEELCEVYSLGQWLKQNIGPEDSLYLRINCEGAECEIIEDLMEHDQIAKVTSALVDWDATTVPSLQEGVAAIQAKLPPSFIDLSTRDLGPNCQAIFSWLDLTLPRIEA